MPHSLTHLQTLDLLDQANPPRILVLGDLMLDRYTWGDADRVSPEAPVLILQADLEEVRLGGAASVASLLRGLDAHVILAGVVGDDASAGTLRKLLADERIDQSAVLCDPDRPTTTKERFVGRAASRHPHQILRVDHEARHAISLKVEAALTAAATAALDKVSAVLISDYAKGVCTPRLLEIVIAAASVRGLPVLVDPARIADYSRYRGATLLKPNRAQAQLATGFPVETAQDAFAAGRRLCDRLDLQAAVITLDGDGMVLVENEGAGNRQEEHYPVSAREVYDITGAGDMALAALGLCQAACLSQASGLHPPSELGQAARLPLPESVRIANLAAGLEVARQGVTPITRRELREAAGDQPERASVRFVTLPNNAVPPNHSNS